jgi:hypothetical protein
VTQAVVLLHLDDLSAARVIQGNFLVIYWCRLS